MKPEQLIEIARLKREVIRLKAERDILKKAAVDSTGERNMMDFMLSLEDFAMAQMGRPSLSSQQKEELWERWKAGQSLSDIGRALGKHAASVFGVLLSKGGIARSRGLI